MSDINFERYGAQWKKGTKDLDIEFACIRRDGKWKNKAGNECGMGLFFHYKEAQKILWPKHYHHRWTDLILQQILDNTITCVTGPKDTGKTFNMAKYALVDYWAFPENTLIIVSSTTLAALEKRVWGEIKSLFAEAKERFPNLPGVAVDSKHAICTDDLSDDAVITRDMRRGVVAIACKNSSGSFVSIADYVGIKQERRRHIGDEMQFMSTAMMDAIANANSGNYKGIFAGNPIGQMDPLDLLSEPEEGWDSFPEPTKTEVWKNKRFLKSNTICLYGPDSPNITDEKKNQFPRLMTQDSIDRVIAGYGKDSHQYYSQCLGVRKAGLDARRVITRALCRQHNAFDLLDWSGTATTKIAALDAAYSGSGGDRCIGGHIEFGKCVDGKIRILIHEPVNVAYSLRRPEPVEDQIAWWVRDYCTLHNIPPENFYYDSTGRGSLGPALARNWSAHIQPVEFGGSATSRPVAGESPIRDPKTGQTRPKLCRDMYSKFVSELWWSVRSAIESDQIRGLTEVLCTEGCAREWKETDGNKIEVEKKSEMRDRCGYSPDYFDWLVCAVEGARRKGFQISKLANQEDDFRSNEWMDKLRDEQRRLRQSSALTFD